MGLTQHSVHCVLAIEVSVLVGCGAALLSDWCPVFTDSVVASCRRLHMLTDVPNLEDENSVLLKLQLPSRQLRRTDLNGTISEA